MKAECPRLFEAEAWRDGRLGGAEAARFRAHLSVCAHCLREVASLEALGEALRAPVAFADELQVRRERTHLLAAFDARLVPASSQARLQALLGAALAVLTLFVLVWALRPARPVAAPPVASVRAVEPEAVLVRADSSARWSRQTEAQRETIVLQSGVLAIKVDHAASPRRLLVLLPDGELEDIGTTFSISAEAGRTTRVSVQEGSVVLRLRGKPALSLGAGESWSPALEPGPSGATASVMPAPHGARPSAAPAVASAVAPNVGDSAAEFRGALAALERGDNSQAESLFRAFVTAHPGDSRAEDATYLRVLALQRTGNPVATQDAASDYLRRYPRGFRKAEIEPLARGGVRH